MTDFVVYFEMRRGFGVARDSILVKAESKAAVKQITEKKVRLLYPQWRKHTFSVSNVLERYLKRDPTKVMAQ